MPLERPRHSYDQADPPSPVTCAVYVVVVLFIALGIVLVLHQGGVI